MHIILLMKLRSCAAIMKTFIAVLVLRLKKCLSLLLSCIMSVTPVLLAFCLLELRIKKKKRKKSNTKDKKFEDS